MSCGRLTSAGSMIPRDSCWTSRTSRRWAWRFRYERRRRVKTVKTLAKLLYVEADEEITDLVDRLRDLSLEDEVTFVVPEHARSLQSAMSFRLLKRYADSYGKRVNLVSGDPRLQAMALEAGFMAFPSLAAYDGGSEVHRPELAGDPSTTGATPFAPA